MRKTANRIICLAAVFFAIFSSNASACSIFVSADANRAYFCNNEDFYNGNTYVWFVPGGKGTYGAALFGFEDAWTEGGMNEKGLALDWAVTEPQKMVYYPDRINPVGNRNRLYFGNINETILKSCATLDDIIILLEKYNVDIFEGNHMLAADRTGASAVFEWHDGKFEVVKKTGSDQIITNINTTNAQEKNYSYSADTPDYSYMRYFAIKRSLDWVGKVSFDASESALAAGSDYLTQYSYICDLKNGEITIYDKRDFKHGRKIVLADELSKGPHILKTSMEAFSIDDRYRRMTPTNNLNPLAAGRGKTGTLIACSLSFIMAVISFIFIRKKRIYLLPAAADLTVILAGLGLMRYGYFLRYGFNFWQSVLLWLPVVFVILASVQVVCAAVLLARRKSRVFIPITINAILSAVVAIELITNVLV